MEFINAKKYDFDLDSNIWYLSDIRINYEKKPFADGCIRQAHHMTIDGDKTKYVIKFVIKEEDRDLEVYQNDIITQMTAKKWAECYNNFGMPKKIDFLTVFLVEFEENGKPVYACAEEFVEGEFKKHNSNGYFCDSSRNTPHAFSHFTWEMSGYKLLICDIQGVGDNYTDPQIVSVDGVGYGMGNTGLNGIADFFELHKCNELCYALNLEPTIVNKY